VSARADERPQLKRVNPLSQAGLSRRARTIIGADPVGSPQARTDPLPPIR
jgi:hypothetical protein